MSMLKSALEVASHGLRVFPVVPSTKVPRVTGWWADATIDPAKIVAWWAEFPTCSVGVACGHDGIVAIDIDGPEGADLWARTANGRTAETLTSISGSGNGLHRLYRLVEGQDLDLVPTRRGAIDGAKGIDVRAKNGQIVAPGSIHKSGGTYQWLDPSAPIAPMPAWLYEAIKMVRVAKEPENGHESTSTIPRERRIELARAHVRDFPAAIEGDDGSGKTIAAACAVVRGFDLDNEGGVEALDEFNARCVPPWSAKDLARKVAEAARIGTDPWGHLLDVDDMSAALAPDVIRTFTGPIAWLGEADLALELSPPAWVVQDLQICPGRPTMIAGYGASGKTLIAQSLLLAFAAGRPIWNAFDAGAGGRAVRHFDHEQGTYATLRRYQRLAKGLGLVMGKTGIDFGVVSFPEIRLDAKNAREAYARACAGANLVLIDALRGAAPGEDENDSKIRLCIDHLGWVSERIGCAFILIHHAGKATQTDKRAGPRGSSAIFDGCGSVLQVSAENPDEPKQVHHTKSAAEAEQGLRAPFQLTIEDGEDRALLVRYRAFEAPQTADEFMVARKAEVLAWVEGHPAASQNGIKIGVKGKHEITVEAIKMLLREGALVNRAANAGDGMALFTRNNDGGSLV